MGKTYVTICTRCNKYFYGKSHFDAERQLDNHVCMTTTQVQVSEKRRAFNKIQRHGVLSGEQRMKVYDAFQHYFK